MRMGNCCSNIETKNQIKKVQEDEKRKALSNNPKRTNNKNKNFTGSKSCIINNNYNNIKINNQNKIKDNGDSIVNNINNRCGLQNIGNNCYLNSGLQILARCSSFLEKLQCFYDVKFPFISLLYDTFTKLLTEKNYDPSPFVKKFCEMNHEFNFGEQSCSQNFIRTVLNNVNNEIIYNNVFQKNILLSYNDYSPKSEREKISYKFYLQQNKIFPESEALSVFTGILKSHLKGACTTCGNYIDNYSFCYFIDQIMYLDSLAPARSSTKTVGRKDTSYFFKDVIKQNISSNDITMDCEKCGKIMKINEDTKIVKLPEILIFTLERYLNGPNNINVIPDEVIDLQPYVDINLKDNKTVYELFAKNIRLGSTKMYGHEICQIKMDEIWYEFNDINTGDKKLEYNNYTYGLFYKKKK